MKNLKTVSLVGALAISLALLVGCKPSDHEHGAGQVHQYTCPMKEHADVISDKPGNCPKCGMKLVEKR